MRAWPSAGRGGKAGREPTPTWRRVALILGAALAAWGILTPEKAPAPRSLDFPPRPLRPVAGPAPDCAAGAAAPPAWQCGRLDRAGRPLVFWHISKCGGTSMCLMALKNGEAVKTREDAPRFLDGRCAHGYVEPEGEYTGTGKPGRCHDGCHAPDGYARTNIDYGDRAELGRAFEVAFAEDRLTFVGPEMRLNPAFDPADLASVFSFTALREPRARLTHRLLAGARLVHGGEKEPSRALSSWKRIAPTWRTAPSLPPNPNVQPPLAEQKPLSSLGATISERR